MNDSSPSGPSDSHDDDRSGYQQPPQYGEPGYGQPGYWQGYGQQPSPYQQPGYEQPGGYQQGDYYGGYGPVPDHPRANLALILGLVGLIGTVLCGVAAIIGPFAWAIGSKAKKEIDASGGRLGGRGQAMTGYVLGIITTVLLVLGIVAVAGLVAVGVSGGFTNSPTY